MRARPGILSLPFLGLLLLVSPRAASADGSLPPLAYRYIHPPAALQAANAPPTNGLRVLPVSYLRAVLSWTVFTLDGQAGIAGPKGSMRFPSSTKAVLIRVEPVETPPGLPSDIAPDGNTYRISAVTQPGNAPVSLSRPISVTLRWPHIPIAIYTYRSGTWKQLCYSDQAVLTGQTISCPSSQLGLFLAVTNPATAGSSIPTTPISSTPFAWINRYIPLLAALVLVIVAAIAAYVVSRPDTGEL